MRDKKKIVCPSYWHTQKKEFFTCRKKMNHFGNHESKELREGTRATWKK